MSKLTRNTLTHNPAHSPTLHTFDILASHATDDLHVACMDIATIYIRTVHPAEFWRPCADVATKYQIICINV